MHERIASRIARATGTNGHVEPVLTPITVLDTFAFGNGSLFVFVLLSILLGFCSHSFSLSLSLSLFYCLVVYPE